MRAYLPYVYGGIAALLALRGAARGGLGTSAQSFFNTTFVSTTNLPQG